MSSIRRLLNPRSLAIVGASPDIGTIGANVLGNVERAGWPGELHLVSRTRDEIGGRSCVKTIDDLPHGIDAIILIVPEKAVKESVEACVRRGIGGAVVFASGFGEAGEEGKREQDAIGAIARAGNLAMLGPNCLGLVNFVAGLPLTFEPVEVPKASTAGVCAIAQSGAMAGNIRMALRSRGVPVSYAISTGNEASLGAEDLLEELMDDAEISLFAVFVEQIRDPQRFLRLARRAREIGKPILLTHPGRSERSREAAKSHTGALAGDYAVMKTFVEREGVLLIDGLDELFDTATILARFPNPPALAAAVMTNSGALRGLSLDFCETIDLPMADLSADTAAKLKDMLPPFAAIDNPLDITAMGMAKPSIFGDSTRVLLEDPNVGMVFAAAMPGGPRQQRDKWNSWFPVLAASKKPVAAAFMGDGSPLDEALLKEIFESGIPFFRSVERALRAFGHVATYGRRIAAIAQRKVSASIGAAIALPASGPVAEYKGKRVLADLGIAIPKGELARNVEDAKRTAAAISYPVVLKAQADALAHKSDAGGVAINIADEQALLRIWDKMQADVARAVPGLALDGILVETMARRGGVEMIVGARRDPQWGAVLMIGLGGIWTELLHDVRLIAADSSEAEILEAIGQLRAAKLLQGYRGDAAKDVAGLAKVMLALGALMRANLGLVEIDINPLLVYENGVVALDALLVAG